MARREASAGEAGGQYIVKVVIGPRVFAPSWFAVLVTVLLLALFMRLGFWQLQRAEEKRQLAAAAQLGKAQVVDYVFASAATLPRYQQVRLSGHYDPVHQILLDNMPSAAGQPGYRVWTPLITAHDEVVLIDRGWVPLGASRQTLPDIGVDANQRSVIGVIDELPRAGTRAGDAGVVNQRWPQVLNYPRHDELTTLFASPLASRIVLLNAYQPDGYERLWRMDQGFTPERHVAYAVQWFGFAITLLVIFFVVNTRRLPNNPSTHPS